MPAEDVPLSFDPRHWAGEATVLPSPAPGSAVPRRRPMLLGGAGLLLLAAPIAAWIGRLPPQGTIAPPFRADAPRVQTPPRDVIERSTTLPGVGDLAAFLRAQGVATPAAATAQSLVMPQLADGPVTAIASLRVGGPGTPDEVLQVRVTRADSSGVLLAHDDTTAQGWRVEPLARSVVARLTVARGEMNADSLYASAVAAGVDESLIPDFAQAFVYDFDFQREIHPGDVFEMAAEQTVNADGQPLGVPTLVYAAFITAEKSRALYRFAPPGAQPGWYDGNGRSIVRSLMRTPVEGARVSSTFGWRVHPVLGFRKLHNGIDFAVPSGTPVYAAGAGTVVAAHFSATAGNMVILQHDKGYLTKYFHFTRFAPGVTEGGHVAQGQEIGLSGTTGRSTGPHLHYEVHLNGAAIDPMSVKTEDGVALTGGALDAFRRERDRIDVARAAHAR